jgi:hypothetical protein
MNAVIGLPVEMTNVLKLRYLLALLVVFEVIFIWSIRAEAHCDTLDGPVIATAKNVLEAGDVTPLLKWVPSDDEQTIRTAFQKTIEVACFGKRWGRTPRASMIGTYVELTP